MRSNIKATKLFFHLVLARFSPLRWALAILLVGLTVGVFATVGSRSKAANDGDNNGFDFNVLNIFSLSQKSLVAAQPDNRSLPAFAPENSIRDVLVIACPSGQKIWDGEGTTNNWSEAANWCNDTLPVSGDSVVFDGTSTKNATIDTNVSVASINITSGYTGAITVAGGINTEFRNTSSQAGGTFNAGDGIVRFGNTFTASPLNLSGGVFNAGGGSLTFNSSLNQTGGMFNGGAGDISTSQFAVIQINAGAFTAPVGTLTLRSSFTIGSGATYDLDNGTIAFIGNGNVTFTIPSETIVKNLTLNQPEGLGLTITAGNIVKVTGTLTLTEGMIIAGTIKAENAVSIASTFGNQSTSTNGSGLILIQDGPVGRTITLPAGVRLPRVHLNDPNVTINTSGSGDVGTLTLTLDAGAVDMGANNFNVGYGGAFYVQNGGTFSIGSGNFTMTINGVLPFALNNGTFTASTGNLHFLNGNVLLTGGTFNAPSGTTTIGTDSSRGSFTQSGGEFNGNGTVDISGTFTLSGGIFNASPANTLFGFTFDHQAGAFNHNGGTVILDGNHPAYSIAMITAGTQFNNLTINNLESASGQLNLQGFTLMVNGTLRIINGVINSGTLRANGDMIVENNADGGSAGITFGGTGNKTYTNNGGVNPTGIWTIDKPGGTVTAASSLILPTSTALNITNGTLYLASGSNLTSGAITIGSGGRLVNDSATTITLGGNLTNSGRVDLQGGGAACPEADTILIRSSVNGTQRSWTAQGAGAFRLADVDVKDMGGSGTKTVYSGTNSGGNNANWVFDNNCPPTLSISPSVVDRFATQTQTFTAGGGFAPYTFSPVSTPSGGSITAGGLYTAGATINVSDIVRVTDNFGSTAAATVNVVPGPPTRAVFIVQPTNTGAGQSITPAVQVALQDNAGNTVTSATDAVTITMGNNPGDSTLSGTTTKMAVNGIATFNNLSLNRTGMGYTLVASSGSLMPATSGAFAISFGAPAQLAFQTQPIDRAVYEFGFVAVVVLDQFGNQVTNATNTVTLAIGSNPGGGTLINGSTGHLVNGATVFNTQIDKPGQGYTLVASSSGLTSATSNPFNITSSYIVTTTNRLGYGSLGDAVNWLRLLPLNFPTPTIRFNILNGPMVIRPTSSGALVIMRSVIIDGTTQPGYTDHPLIELDGSLIPGAHGGGLLIIGGNSTIKGLAIYNFKDFGLQISGSNNIIQGNYIGTAGDSPSNQANGIVISNGENNLIGGTTTGTRNVISGNSSAGIFLYQTSASSSTTIKGNLIGTNDEGSPVPNGIGIQAFLAQTLTIGGPQPGEGNVIAFNSQAGIFVNTFFNDGTSRTVRGNSIHSNGQLGIDVAPAGINANGLCGGFGQRQHFPVLTLVQVSGGNTTIEGTLDAPFLFQSYTVDFFLNPTADPSGHGEGQIYLGSTTFFPGSSCNTAFSVTLPVTVQAGTYVSATATINGFGANTSEFSPFIGPTARIQGTVREGLSSGPVLRDVQVRLTATDLVRDVLTDSNGRFSFDNLPLGITYTVTPSHPNYIFTPRVYTNLSNDEDDTHIGILNAFDIYGAAYFNNLALPGVTFTLSGAEGTTTMTPGHGYYRFSDRQPGTYTITPSKAGYSFTPPSATRTINISGVSANFTATATGSLAFLPGKIVFDKSDKIKTMNANGSGLAIIQSSYYPPHISGPIYSRSGSKIAYLKGYPETIVTIDSDGSNAIDIPTSAGGVRNLAWSSDSTKFAFQRYVGSGQQIFTVNSNGSEESQKTVDSRNIQPDWSPDGSKLVFSREDPTANGRNRIFTVDANGTNVNLTRLTDGLYNSDSYPKWSPDGSKIAFIRYDYDLEQPSIDLALIVLMNPDGTNQTVIESVQEGGYYDLEWSPDGSRLAFTRRINDHEELVSILADGSDEIIIDPNLSTVTREFDWGKNFIIPTSIGTDVLIGLGRLQLHFPSVNGPNIATSGGETEITPIAPDSAGAPPSGYNLAGFAYNVSTTANYTPPVRVCFKLETGLYTTQAQFDKLRVLHNEDGVLVDRTVLPNDFVSRKICASASSLGAFVLAELEDSAMPKIRGLIIDQNRKPLIDVPVDLSGDEKRFTSTDVDGLFSFSNLIQGGNYILQPAKTGYLFNLPYQSYIGIDGEKTVIFTATAANFDISGSVRDPDGSPIANVTISLNNREQETTTDAAGNYTFTGLPANGTFRLTASKSGLSFTPLQVSLAPLTSNLTGINFTGSTACTLSLVTTSQSFTASGGAGSIHIIAPAGCNWNASSNNPDFLTITSSSSGSGNTTLSYSVAPHSNTGNRTGTITIANQTFTVFQGAAFLDVPPSHPFYTEIGKLSARGVTLGCGDGNYCPDQAVTREQMAAFILRVRGEFNPPTPATQRFDDVPPSNPFYNFIDRMALLQITLGCGGNPPLYCPTQAVTREQMAAFIIRALHEPGYLPPPPSAQRFNDVPPENSFYSHIEEMAMRGITLGCSANPPLYCPTQAVTRAQMAAFLVRAFIAPQE